MANRCTNLGSFIKFKKCDDFCSTKMQTIIVKKKREILKIRIEKLS